MVVLQTHGTSMGTKMVVAFSNIFMAEFETKLICQSRIKPIEWKRYIDDVFSLCNKSKQDINLFIEQANQFHPSIKFTADISENEITFLDTIIYKGDRLSSTSILTTSRQKPSNTRISPPATPITHSLLQAVRVICKPGDSFRPKKKNRTQKAPIGHSVSKIWLDIEEAF